MKKEIGSEFWDIPLSKKENNLFNDDTKWFISGRSALDFVIQEVMQKKSVKTAAIPSWCCDSMIIPFLENGIKVFFYSVYMDEHRQLVCDYDSTKSCDMTLVMDYFGYTGQKNIGIPSGTIIRDLTHSIFCKQYDDAEYYFGSLRKWAGFWTGGYAWSVNPWSNRVVVEPVDKDYIDARRQAMLEKADYIAGKSSSKNYLNIFGEAEESLDDFNVRAGAIRDIEMARMIDVGLVKQKRRENAQTLLKHLSNVAVFPILGKEDCPLFVPILLPSAVRDALRRYLIQHNIYCPIHWGVSEFHLLNNATEAIYNSELSIVCDQRYDVEDMQHIVDLIESFDKNITNKG